MTIDDFDAIECNEAFAAIALMWAKEFLPDATGALQPAAAAPSPSAIRSAPAACAS